MIDYLATTKKIDLINKNTLNANVSHTLLNPCIIHIKAVPEHRVCVSLYIYNLICTYYCICHILTFMAPSYSLEKH